MTEIKKYFECNKIIWESDDRKARKKELRQRDPNAHFVKQDWAKGPGYLTLRKGKWYCFKNYEIVNNILRPIPNLYFQYKKISNFKQFRLKIVPIREPYSNILGVIQDVSDLDQFSREYPFRVIEILLEDGNTVQILLKNRFATERKERFQTGELIYIYGCKKNINLQTQEIWYSSLTNNTKIKFDLQSIRQHIDKEKFEKILNLQKKLEIQDEATGQIE